MTIKYALLVFYLLSINILQRKAKNFKQEKLIDIFRYILLYVIMIVCFSDDKICLCFIMFFSMISSTAQLYVYLKLRNIKGNSNFRWVLISCTIELFISMALTYYTLYTINSNWFEINGILLNSVEQKLFEFAYLAFSIVTTYSSGIIILTGVVPRIFQIIHTVIVLTVLAKTLKLIFSEE